jgi:beta-glucanase (GH16 family)
MLNSPQVSARSQRPITVSTLVGPLVAAFVLATLTLCALGPSTAQNDRMVDLAAYRQTFSEDFDSLDVSPWGPGTRWIAHTPYNGDFGDGAFAHPVPGFPFTIENGVLRIEARKDNNGKWHSGLLSSIDRKGNGFAQQYGYFEMRAKLPAGDGVWPAFWLLGDNGTETRAEIDIIEYYGHDPAAYQSAVHVWDHKSPDKSRVAGSRIVIPPGTLSREFHTFGASIDPNMIRFYFDRHEVWNTKTMAEHQRPMYLLVDLAVGGGWPIANMPNPSFMYVDYIRAWRHTE